MKKAMPKNVSIMGRVIPIKYVPKSTMEKFMKDAEGVWDSYERCIYINKEAPRNIQLYYIYHEVTHAMHCFTGIDQMLPNEFVEILCQTNATLIEDILNQSRKMK